MVCHQTYLLLYPLVISSYQYIIYQSTSKQYLLIKDQVYIDFQHFLHISLFLSLSMTSSNNRLENHGLHAIIFHRNQLILLIVRFAKIIF